MATDEMWIRLNLGWDRDEWIRYEKRSVRNIWPDLLRWVKMNSPIKGYIRFTTAKSLAFDMRYESPEEVEEVARLIAAATEGGAIRVEDGRLEIVNWDDYQNPETIRKRKERDDSGMSGNVRTDPDESGLSAKTADSRRKTEVKKKCIQKEKVTDLVPDAPTWEWIELQFSSNGFENTDDRTFEFVDHYERKNWMVGKSRIKSVQSILLKTWIPNAKKDPEPKKEPPDPNIPREGIDYRINSKNQMIDLVTKQIFDQGQWLQRKNQT